MVKPLKTHPLASVDCQLLFRDLQPLPSPALTALVEEAAAAIGLAAGTCSLIASSADLDFCFLCGGLQIQITQSVPFKKDDYLQIALDTFSFESNVSYAPSIDPDLSACTHVSVQPRLPVSSEDGRDSEPKAAFETAAESFKAMALAKAVALLILAETDVEAVFWAPSTFYLDAPTFKRVAKASNPLLLYLHCLVHVRKDPQTGEALTGVATSGAQWLTGHVIDIPPCPEPAGVLVEQAYDFVAQSLKAGDVVQEASQLDAGGLDLSLTQQAAEGVRPARTTLTFQAPAAPSHIYTPPALDEVDEVDGTAFSSKNAFAEDGLKEWQDELEDVFPDASPGSQGNAPEPKLDPGPPIDTAILDRLAAMKFMSPDETGTHESPQTVEDPAPELSGPAPEIARVAETGQDTASSPDRLPEPEADLSEEAAALAVGPTAMGPAATGTPIPETPPPSQSSQPQPAIPAKRHMSMAELRNFAREAQVSLPVERSPRARANGSTGFRLIGKIFPGKSG